MPSCPYCKEELHVKLSAQLIDEIDPKFYDIYQEWLKQYQIMVEKTVKMKLDPRQYFSPEYFPLMSEYPPMVEIITCTHCGTALEVTMHRRASLR